MTHFNSARPLFLFNTVAHAPAHARPCRRRRRRRAYRRARAGFGGAQDRRHAGQDPADADRAAGFRRRRAERRRTSRATSRRSSPPISSAPACSRRSIRRPTSRRSSNIDALPRFADWRAINAQALVTGRITRQGDGRLKAEFRLWDVFAGQQLTGQQYFTTPDNWRRVAHIISDAIYERLTGEKGYFDSRVVFVDESGPKEQPRQAARHHGSGRRQRALPHPRRRSRADAALLAVDAGNHLHVLRAAASRGSICSTSRPASARWSATSPT